MKLIKNRFIGVIIFLATYAAMPHLYASYDLVFFMFILSNALLLYSVYQILKNGIVPKDKFDDGYWYANVDKQYSIESPRDTE